MDSYFVFYEQNEDMQSYMITVREKEEMQKDYDHGRCERCGEPTSGKICKACEIKDIISENKKINN